MSAFLRGSGWCGCGRFKFVVIRLVDFGVIVLELDSSFRGIFVWSWVVMFFLSQLYCEIGQFC